MCADKPFSVTKQSYFYSGLSLLSHAQHCNPLESQRGPGFSSNNAGDGPWEVLQMHKIFPTLPKYNAKDFADFELMLTTSLPKSLVIRCLHLPKQQQQQYKCHPNSKRITQMVMTSTTAVYTKRYSIAVRQMLKCELLYCLLLTHKRQKG